VTFVEFLESSSEGQRIEMTAHWQNCCILLRLTGPQRQFVINFDAECRLGRKAWEGIRIVVSTGFTVAKELQKELAREFRKHLLASDAITLPVPAPLGRAVTKERYLEIMREQFGFNSQDEEDQFVSDLFSNAATTESNRTLLRGKLLARHGRVMWATFDVVNGTTTGEDPFAQIANDADGIRAQLGLDPNETGLDLLLFVYRLPDDAIARFPTLAEAYAGDDWSWYFRPSGKDESWGLTMTWPSCQLPPCPEIVHEPIKSDNLTDKIRIVRGASEWASL